MPASKSLSEYRLAIDDLDRAILTLAGRINAATYELLVLVREFDERAGWLKWGFDNCAQCALQYSEAAGASAEARLFHPGKCVRELAASYYH